ncbi:MAG: response regulator [Candidatus Rokubacteria bacterium]|nr:response regulator [Candidatus Rokubacteria bacterium]
MADGMDDIKPRLLATFRAEAEEHLQTLAANLAALERGLPPAEAGSVLEATFREVHTLKGAARSVSLMDVEALCQALESVLSRITRSRLAPTGPILSCLQDGVDGVARLLTGSGAPVPVRDLIARLAEAAAGAAPAGTQPSAAAAPPDATAATAGLPPADTLRLGVARLDALLLLAEDLLAPKLAAAERARDAMALVEAVARCRAASGRSRSRPDPGGEPGTERARLEPELSALDARARQLLAQLLHDERAIARNVDGLLDDLRKLRMMPASTVLDLFPRMLRDLARQHGKDVEFVVQGDHLEVDRKVLQAMKEPLIHLVRNAIDHGIELPEARARAGKPSRGRIAATVVGREDNRVEITVEDDGGGIDLAGVRATAVRSGFVRAEEAEALTDDEAVDLIFRSGLSTSAIITDVSGHGLGLTIVKERVEQLGGELRVATRGGGGTTVRMMVPATIATFRGVLVRAGGQLFLVPLEAVGQAIRIARDEIESVQGRAVVRWNGHALPVAPLSGLLGLPEPSEPSEPSEPGSRWPCVVVKVGEERAGLVVEEVLGDREVVVKEFGPPLHRVRNLAGVGLLGTGQVAPILRPGDLLQSVREAARQPAPPVAPTSSDRAPVILVVDDSITTRTMEKSLLETAGYRVLVAVDGIEAWTLLKSVEIDLVVSDVDMPRMDGFDLTARIRADQRLANLPVILVTALEAREDKERGIEVGANAYIVKSTFDRSNLLEIVRRLA